MADKKKLIDKIADTFMSTPDTDTPALKYDDYPNAFNHNAIKIEPSSPSTDDAFLLASKNHDVSTMESLIGKKPSRSNQSYGGKPIR